jgi:D-alanine-D-alanine ligase-like ATP-grasp enzyme
LTTLLLIRAAARMRAALLRRGARGIGAESTRAFYREIWSEAAAALGAEIRDLPGGFLDIRRGRERTRLRESSLEIDHPATVALAHSKSAAQTLIREAGLPVPDSSEFDLGTFRRAVEFLREGDGSCVVKPAHGSGGDGVTTNVRSVASLARAAFQASLISRTVVIERQISGDYYRLLYLDGELLDALRRRPPGIVGDGRANLRELVRRENDRRASLRGAAGHKRITVTADLKETLRAAGLSLRSVLGAGRTLAVKTATNEAGDRDTESVLAEIGPAPRDEGARAAAVLGVRLAGVDVILRDPAASLAESGGAILEVNASPGLHYHYQTRDPARRVAVAVPVLDRLLAESASRAPAEPGRRRSFPSEPAAAASARR